MKGFVPTPTETVDLMVARLFEERGPRPEETILDPGCGDGAFVDGIVRWCRARGVSAPHIVAIDSDPRLVEAARKRFSGAETIQIRERDFLTEPISSRFSFIICNPPYVPITDLSQKERATYRGLFATARGRFDLYLLFFERAASLLVPEGRLVFITPEKFLYVNTAQTLRRLLAKSYVRYIQLVKEDTFGDLVTYPTITTIVNSAGSKATTTVILRNGAKRETSLPRGGQSWWPFIHAGNDVDGDLANGRDDFTLDTCCLRVSCGVATGADEVFSQPTRELSDCLRPFAFPTIAGRQLVSSADHLPALTHSLLVPYARDGSLLAVEKLEGLGTYLERPANKRKLLKRTCVKAKPWYAFHENPPLLEILRPKILCKDITPKARFWVDQSGELVPRHSVYYIVPKNVEHLDALCSYLNSAAVARWLATHCQRAANGFLRLQSHVLKKIPIPLHILRYPPDRVRPHTAPNYTVMQCRLPLMP